jgi:DNA primase
VAYSIPEDVVERVRESADIVEIVSEHLRLRQTGRNFKALCPFHSEKTPSFIVSPEKQIYHCFGCGAGGNVFNFLMQVESISFPEAVRMLADRYGIEIPKAAGKTSTEASLAYKLNAMAAKVYHSALSGTKEGTGARKYLRARGISESIERDFLLGYAPSDGNMLVLEAKRRKIDGARLQALGLAIEREGRLVDLFRRRLIFPIASAGGRILGFGGRVLDEGQPKYLNSPETRIFKKADTIYGIHRAKSDLRSVGRALLVEGYMDVIPLYAGGFRNTVASLGTAFTFDQARRIRRYCGEVILLYDGDEAGRIAALRACEPAAAAGLKIRIVNLPEGHDPDSFLRDRGPDALSELITGATHYVDFALSYGPSDDPEEAVKFVLRIVSAIRDPIRVSLDLKRLSDRSGISEIALQKSLGSMSREKRSGPPAEGDQRKVEPIACDKIEKSIISMVIGIPQCADRIFDAISPTDFADQRMQRIAEMILDRRSRGLAFDVSALLSAIEDEPTRQLLIESSVTGDFGGDAEKAVSDHISCMKRRAIGREIEGLRKQIQMAEKAGDAELLQSLLSRRQSLAQDLKLLST